MGPAIVTGAATLIVAVVGAIGSYVLSRRRARQELEDRLGVLSAEAEHRRGDIELEYRMQAARKFLETTAGPKGQVIEAVHDLSQRMEDMLFRDSFWGYVDQDEYYRASTAWFIVRPIVWTEILRRRMVHVDQTLGDVIAEEHRFLRYCQALSLALTQARLFPEDAYDQTTRTAHVLQGKLSALVDDMITRDDSGASVCIGYGEFEERVYPRSRARPIAQLVDHLDRDGRELDFRIARFVALLVASNTMLEEYRLPFRPAPRSVAACRAKFVLLRPELREPIKARLDEYLAKVLDPVSSAATTRRP